MSALSANGKTPFSHFFVNKNKIEKAIFIKFWLFLFIWKRMLKLFFFLIFVKTFRQLFKVWCKRHCTWASSLPPWSALSAQGSLGLTIKAATYEWLCDIVWNNLPLWSTKSIILKLENRTREASRQCKNESESWCKIWFRDFFDDAISRDIYIL